MSKFDEALLLYSNLPQKTDVELNAMITNLDTQLAAYRRSYSASPSSTDRESALRILQGGLIPINDYYTKMKTISQKLRSYLKDTTVKISNSQDRLINEERYSNRVYPEESTAPRELMYGIFPKFRESSLAYIMTAGVFMALMTIFLIFHLLGLTGQLNVPPSISQLFSPATTVGPFYKNPMILGGMIAVLSSALVIFIILYFKAKKANSS
jgi:hypothetical protein